MYSTFWRIAKMFVFHVLCILLDTDCVVRVNIWISRAGGVERRSYLLRNNIIIESLTLRYVRRNKLRILPKKKKKNSSVLWNVKKMKYLTNIFRLKLQKKKKNPRYDCSNTTARNFYRIIRSWLSFFWKVNEVLR